MARMNRKYDKAFKLEAIRLYETSGKSVSQIETELGMYVVKRFRTKKGLEEERLSSRISRIVVQYQVVLTA